MPEALALVQAILQDSSQRGATTARQFLHAALSRDVDPLDYLAHQTGLGETEVRERAARHTRLAFSPELPAQLARADQVNIDALGDIRSIRGQVFDRELIFLAPTFPQFLALARHVDRHPEARRAMCIVPPRTLRGALCGQYQSPLLSEARLRLFRKWPRASAHLELTMGNRLAFLAALVLLLLLVVVSPFLLRPMLLPLVALLLLAPAAIRFAAILPGLAQASREDPPALAEANLPVYSVLVPLRDEAQVVPQLARALRALDYPSDKLDIKFVVETASAQTMAAVQRELYSPQFEVIAVPEGLPATKPKALNYALPFVRGTRVVVYDAEDIPAPDQLKRTAALFAARPDIACIQAELVADNTDQSWLAALFGAEYAGLFGILLPALARWRMPMPLGGSSNHFRKSALLAVGGWDAFNVTEDADIGLRLARFGMQTTTLASMTQEEAPVHLGGWLAQRTRWMKGWMQTFLVHNADPLALLRDLGWWRFLAFEIYVGGMILSPPLHTMFMAAIAAQLVLGGPLPFAPWDVYAILELSILGLGYGSAIVLTVLGLFRLGQGRQVGWQLLFPLYWLLMGWAWILAGHELLRRPFFWAKTVHGQSRRRGVLRSRLRENVPKPGG